MATYLSPNQREYVEMLTAWTSDGRPDSLLDLLDRLWWNMSITEQFEVDDYLDARDRVPRHRRK